MGLALGCLAFAACVGDEPSVAPSGGQDDAAVGDGGGPGDGAVTHEGGDTCTAGDPICVDGATLGTCGSSDTQTCTFGCINVGGAHCGVMQPSLPVTASDLGTTGVTDVDVTADAFLDTDNGAIDNLRAANDSPSAREQKSGITYQLVGGVGVFIVKSLKVETGVALKLRGTAAAAIVATQTMTIVGVVDARGYDKSGALCAANVAGPGGSSGAATSDTPNGNATGAGGGLGVVGFTDTSGPGGGGYGGPGGAGGGYPLSAGGTAPLPGPIAGGFGGGASGASGGSNGAPGGGGGGAVQLVAGVSINVGGGANPGGINAGGCGGKGAAFGNTGSGAGSGGTILLQAPTLSIAATGVLAANGGGGSTGNGSGPGENGKLSNGLAIGAAANGGYGKGGDGSSALSPVGQPGGTGTKGGGGGGGSGRIRLENVSGSVTPATGGIVSPKIDVDVDGGIPPTTVGVLLTK